jgi:HEPN domain-containing protein
MTMRPEKTLTIRSWVLKAESDFRNAENTLLMKPEECPFDTVCFHAQQLAEKYLKALLVLEDIDFPKTHDIGEIIELLPPRLKPSVNLSEQVILSDYAIESRYPVEDPGKITSSQASEALAIARRIRDWARTHLPALTLP